MSFPEKHDVIHIFSVLKAELVEKEVKKYKTLQFFIPHNLQKQKFSKYYLICNYFMAEINHVKPFQ